MLSYINMAREKLSPEEAERRNKECRQRYNEAHREELLEKQRQARMADPEAYRAKRREQYHAAIDKLVEAGVYTPMKPGEAVEVAKRQRRECYLRRQERLNAGRALLAQAEGGEQ